MFFKRSRSGVRKEPIELAFDMLRNSMLITYGYQNNKNYRLTENELRAFDSFRDELFKSYCTASYISRCLHQRSHGEAEGSEKFTNPDSFDYHFPK